VGNKKSNIFTSVVSNLPPLAGADIQEVILLQIRF